METALTLILNCFLGLLAGVYAKNLDYVAAIFWMLVGVGNTLGGWNTCQVFIASDKVKK